MSTAADPSSPIVTSGVSHRLRQLRTLHRSGPSCDCRRRASAIARTLIMKRGDVHRYEGRFVKPEDNGFATGERLTPEFPAWNRRCRPRPARPSPS